MSRPRTDLLAAGDHLRLLRRHGWEYVEHVGGRDSVAALATTPANEVVLIEQRRPPVEAVVLELPAGIVEPGEPPEHAVVRELMEETGFAPRRRHSSSSARRSRRAHLDHPLPLPRPCGRAPRPGRRGRGRTNPCAARATARAAALAARPERRGRLAYSGRAAPRSRPRPGLTGGCCHPGPPQAATRFLPRRVHGPIQSAANALLAPRHAERRPIAPEKDSAAPALAHEGRDRYFGAGARSPGSRGESGVDPRHESASRVVVFLRIGSSQPSRPRAPTRRCGDELPDAIPAVAERLEAELVRVVAAVRRLVVEEAEQPALNWQ